MFRCVSKMRSKYLIFFIALIKLVASKSFTIVLDTTSSMQNEIDIIKINIQSIADELKNVPEFEDFIVVPFNDPDVGPPITSTDFDSLKALFSSISAAGGNECPEDSLSGIQKALENSKPNSFVYVFTDAYAKDITRFKDIENLCKNTQSQVVIFLTGDCYGTDVRTRGYIDVYYEIAKVCSGAVLKFDSINLRKAFNYMKEMVKADWNDITSHEPFPDSKQFTINVDFFTSDFMIAISGDYPTLQVVDIDNRRLEMQKIVNTRQSLIVRAADLRPGEYQVTVRCQGRTSVTFYKKSRVPYQYGFSTRLPNSLKETSLRPMPGRQNYILIVLPQYYNFKITSMELQMTDGSDKKLLSIEESQIREGFYTTSLFVEPSNSFSLLIHGRDSSYQETTITTKIIKPQEPVTNAAWSKPVAEILELDNNLIYFGTFATMVCKVIGYPKPEIVWQDVEETTLTSEELLLEVPSVYLSYVTVNVTSNNTFHCKAMNKEGKDEQYIELFVNRTFSFDVIQTPQSGNFEYGSEGKLYCEVYAYPEAEIKWSHNGTSIEYSDNTEFVEDENALVIKNMTLNDAGFYECEVSNEVRRETFNAEVTISGLEAPQLVIDNSYVDLKPGDWINIVCRVVKGNPPPGITWEYQNSNEINNNRMPSDVFVDGTELKISVASKNNIGTYRCVANNMLGEDSKEVSVNIKYAPIITNSDDGTVNVKEGDVVALPCEVDSTPEATVRWEAFKGDEMLNFDSRHIINDRHTLQFNALWKDSGIYHCIAENEVGRTETTINVHVLVPPFIQPTESEVVTVASGRDVTLQCQVLYGNPVPSTKWEFIATDSTTSVLSRGHSTILNLYLTNVSKANEGMYLCIADNEIGNDRIRISLRVN